MEGRVALYPSPGRGHLVSMVELGTLITQRHPSISITIIIISLPHEAHSIGSYVSKVSLANPSITFVPLPPPSGLSLTPPSSPQEMVASFFEVPKHFNHSLREALSTLHKSSNLKALVIDYFCNAAVEVSSELNIPAYYFCAQGASGICVFLYLPMLDNNRSTGGKRLKDIETPIEFPGVPPIPSKVLPSALLDTSHRNYNYFIETSIQMAKSSGLIFNTFESLEQRAVKAIREGRCTPGGELKVPPIYCVGPVVTSSESEEGNKQVNECLTWLDSQPSQSVVFLCFGSLGVFPAGQLKEMAVGLEKSGVRFLWVVRNPPDARSGTHDASTPNQSSFELEPLLPEGFLERTKGRGLVVKLWAPQVAVLNHGSVGGFVTHCGWNSVLEAVCAGVPMLAWPLYAEQRMNRHFLVEEMELALAVEESEDGFVSAAELAERVTELMSMEKGQMVRRRVVAMKQDASRALGDGGTSHVAMAKLVHSFKEN